MIAYLVLLLSVLSRVVPHAWSFTAVGGGLLYFGARRSRAHIAAAVAILAATDLFLTHFVYGYRIVLAHYLLTWAWYAAVALAGSAILARRATVLRVVAAALGTSTSFFLISNFAVWASFSMYPRTPAGLAACYAAGLPFYGNDSVATLALASLLFGAPALYRRLQQSPAPSGSAA